MYTNPSIDFILSSGEILHTNKIIKDSIVIDRQLLSNLKSSSSTATFTLAREPLSDGTNLTVTGKVLNESDEVKIIIYDGTITIFTGWINPYKTWQLSLNGTKDVNLTAMDNLTHSFKATWGKELLKGTLSECLVELCQQSGVTISSPQLTDLPNVNILCKTSPSSTIQTIMQDLLLEVGYCYTCDALGNIEFLPINLDENTTPSVTLYSAPTSSMQPQDGLLWASNGSAVVMQRSPTDIKQAEVSYTTLRDESQLPIYKQTDVTVPEGDWWDGMSHHSDPLDDSYKPTLSTTSGHGSIYFFVGLGNRNDAVRGLRFSWKQTVLDFGINGSLEFFLTDTNDSTQAWGRRLSPVYKFELDKALFGDDKSAYFYDQLIAPNPSVSFMDTPYLCIKNGSTFTRSEFDELTCTGVYGGYLDEDAIYNTASVEATNLRSSAELMYLYTDTLTTVTTQTGGDACKTIRLTPHPTRNLELQVFIDNSNNTTTEAKFNELSAKCNAIVVASEANYSRRSLDRTYSTALPTYSYTARYIHDRTNADKLSENLMKFHCFCSNTYSFNTDLDLSLGDVCHIVDNMYSTVVIDLVVTKKTIKYKLNGGTLVYQYQGYALSGIKTTQLRSKTGVQSDKQYSASKTLRFRGEWQDDVTYENNEVVQDVVQWNGSSWACTTGNTGEEPSSESEYWALVAEAGGNAIYKEYSLSTSEDVYDGSDDWYDDVSDRYRHNLYVWARDCSDLEEGGTIHGTPYYDWQLTSVYQSQVICTIVPISYSYVIDSRADESEETEIQCYIDNRGWDVSSWQWTVSPDDPTVCYFDIYERTLYVKKNTNVTEISLSIDGLDENGNPIEGCSYILRMKGQNQTAPRQYLGVFEPTSMPTASKEGKTLLEGDCCLVITTDGTDTWYEPWVYRSLLSDFEELADDASDWSDVMGACGQEALELMQDNPSALGKSKYSFFQNIIAKNITADLISATTITRNYSEDSNGAPLTGYRIDADESEVKIANATFGNCTLLGDNAILDTPAITTSNDKSDVESYSGDSTSNTNWFNYSEVALPNTSWVSASGTYDGQSVDSYRGTTASQITIFEKSNLDYKGELGQYHAFTFNVPVSGTYSVSWQGTQGALIGFSIFGAEINLMKTTGGFGIFTSGGTQVYYEQTRAYWNDAKTVDVYLSKGTYEARAYNRQEFSWDATRSKGWFSIKDNIGKKGFATTDGSFIELKSGWSSNSINSLRINGTVYTFSPKKVWQNNMKKGTTAVLKGAISNVDSSTSTLTINGTTRTGYIGVSWSEESCIFRWANSSTETISKTSYKDSFSFSFDTIAMTGFVKTTTLLPKVANQTDIGSTTEGRYGTIYLMNEPQWVSRREYKKDIEDFDENALEAILGTSVKTFRMKTDEPNAPKRLGFIADDTNHYMSQEHQGVSTSACIGMLIKAIQQMQAEITSLQEELKKK